MAPSRVPTGTAGTGVALFVASSVTNQSDGTITGDSGIYASGGSVATVVNAGVIVGEPIGAGGAGLYLLGGGTVTNEGTGTIYGYHGIEASGALTVVNSGTVTGYHDGIGLAGGYVNNQSGGTISGSTGISGSAGVTVVNDGSITATGTASYADAGVAWARADTSPIRAAVRSADTRAFTAAILAP